MDLLVLGTSNCIGPDSYAAKLGRKLGASFANFSVGASSSTLGLYQLHKVQPAQLGIALIDFAINDGHTGWYLWGQENAPNYIADNIRTIVARLRSMNFLPIMVLAASCPNFEFEPFGNKLHSDICVEERINFIDIRRLVIEAIGHGAKQADLMRDDYHLSERAAEAVAAFLEAIVRLIDATTVTFQSQSASVLQSRAIYASQLFPPSALISRGSSLRAALHGRLGIGETVHLPMASTERLAGLMMNVGSKGGMVVLRGNGPEVVKSMTTYWNPARPDSFGSAMIDFGHPLPGGVAGVTIQIVDPDAVPTEPTIHCKPIIPGRYGEIEIEGALLIECDRIQYDHTCPNVDWLPLDLRQLPEAQGLRERLAS